MSCELRPDSYRESYELRITNYELRIMIMDFRLGGFQF